MPRFELATRREGVTTILEIFMERRYRICNLREGTELENWLKDFGRCTSYSVTCSKTTAYSNPSSVQDNQSWFDCKHTTAYSQGRSNIACDSLISEKLTITLLQSQTMPYAQAFRTSEDRR